ncbi:MAG: PKD domain-containing protein [Chitinophagales bacterium]
MQKLKLSLALLLPCFGIQLFATHIIGGELITTCSGGSTYEVKLILYRDCTGYIFDDWACIGVFNEDGDLEEYFNLTDLDITDVDVSSPDPCIEIPPGLCVEQGVYTGTYTLPNTSEKWNLVYQRCCRNPGIVNIEDPDVTGLTVWAEIPAIDDFDCNSSPYFNNYPPLAICVGTPLNFDYSATDPDGDSLAYKFITPYDGGSFSFPQPCPPTAPGVFDPIDWESGYSETYQVDALPELAIDPFSGLLTGTPNAEGRYVVGIGVEEWRDGVLLSTHFRDFQFNIQTCEITTLASTADYVLNCEDYSVTFENYSTGAEVYFWDFGDGYTSDEFEPVHVYGDTGTYYVTLIANPGFACSDTFYSVIEIFNTLTADFSFVFGCSNEPVNFTDLSVSTEAGEINGWLWEFGDGSTSLEQHPEHLYSIGGDYIIVLTVTTDKGCISSDTIVLNLNSGPTANFAADSICFTETAEFENLTTWPFDVTLATYNWTFGDGTFSTVEDPEHYYFTPGDYDVMLIAVTDNGCSDTIILPLNVGELPYPDAGEDDTIEFYELYFLSGSGNGSFLWTPDEYVNDPTLPNPSVNLASTTIFTLAVTSPDGCWATDDVIIHVMYLPTMEIPNAFSPNGDGLNDVVYIVFYENIFLHEFSIYDRWGEQVFKTNNLTEGWNGIYKNKHAEVGTYMYTVRAQDEDGLEILRTGSIVLLR